MKISIATGALRPLFDGTPQSLIKAYENTDFIHFDYGFDGFFDEKSEYYDAKFEQGLHDVREQAEKQGAAMYCAEDALFCLASEVESPQNVIFSCMQPQWDAAALDDREQVLLLDGLQDPGNLGTILRTAEAFALGAVVLCEGCADPFSPKVVRSTMGAVFRLPCVQLPLADALARLKTAGLPVYATALHEDSVPLSSVSLGRAAVIIGSEGRGVSESALRLSDRRVIIPMHGRAESLNAGVAAAIVIYEMTK